MIKFIFGVLLLAASIVTVVFAFIFQVAGDPVLGALPLYLVTAGFLAVGIFLVYKGSKEL